MTFHDQIRASAVAARAQGKLLLVSDARLLLTAGLPEVREDHLYFPPGSPCFLVESTGKMGGKIQKSDELKDGRIIALSAVIAIDFCLA